MKFLCLHGRGTNSDIFETQLAALFSRLSPQHTFDFIDGPFESPAAPGISSLYPGPYLAWHAEYETRHIQPVHDYLRAVIEEDGPYDGVIGFSQGAALAASMLLCDEHEYSINCGDNAGPLFKVAILFNSVMLFSPSTQIGSNIGEEAKRQEEKHINFLRGLTPSPTEFNQDDKAAPRNCKFSDCDEGYSSDYTPNIFGFQPETFRARISIPTLHIIGTRDRFAEHSQALVKLCQPGKAEVLHVDGGHDLPRTGAALDRCADLFELVVAMASLGG